LSDARRIPALDGVRGVAILMVLLWHCIGDILDPAAFWGAGVLRSILSIGWSGVHLFFVLSGYLIAGQLLEARYTSFAALKPYFTKRFFRIVPAYLILLLAFAFLMFLGVAGREEFSWLFARPMPMWSYLSFTQNFAMAWEGTYGARFMSPTWSLAVEEQFYLFLPTVLLACRYSKSIVLPLAMIVVGTISRVATPGWADVVLPTSALDALGGGVLVAMLQRDSYLWGKLKAKRSFVLFGGTVLWVGVVVMMFAPGFAWKFNKLWLAAAFTWLVLVCVLGSSRRLNVALSSGFLKFLGRVSYSIYLFHYPIMGLVFFAAGVFVPVIAGSQGLALALLTMVAATLLASVVHTLVEAPAVRVGHRLAARAA
jgi:peptidoglycan/LPS O-acetylase OafA/YrhL